MPKCEICGRELKDPDSLSHINSKYHQDAFNKLTTEMEYVIYKRYPTRYVFLEEKNVLNLSKKRIYGISSIEGLEKLSNLKELNLKGNAIREIEDLNKLINLRKLDLSENYDIKEIKGLENLIELEELNLYGTHIYEIWGIENLNNLHRLNLGRTHIEKEIIEELGGLDENGWTNNPQKFVEYCRQLKGKAVLYEHRVRMVKDGKLSFSNYWIENYGNIKGLKNLTNLKELDLHGNCFREIIGLENLINLEVLDLSDPNTFGSPDPWADAWGREFYPPISEIKGLDKLNKLKELYLGGHNITKIKGLENLVNLEILDLNSQLAYIDSHRLVGIKNLKDPFNKIKGLENLANLKVLNLRKNEISKIEGLENLTNLRVLDLSGNSIKKIEGLENLRNLQELYLADNRIDEHYTLNIGSDYTPIKGLENLHKLEKFDLKIEWVFQVNKFLNVHKGVDDKIKIFAGDKLFESKIHLLLKIPKIDDELFFDFDSIDDVVLKGYRYSKGGWNLWPGRDETIEELRKKADGQVYGYSGSELHKSHFNKYRNCKIPRIPLDDIFWGCCSNLQVWVENNYNTRLLHSKVAFPLLKLLMEAGDPMAHKIFKEEIIEKFLSGSDSVITYLSEERYLDDFTEEELISLVDKCKDSPETVLGANQKLAFLALKTYVNDPKTSENQFQFIQKAIERLPIEKRAEKLNQIGKNLVNVKLKDLNSKNVHKKTKTSDVNLGIEVLDLATEYSNCPESLIFLLSKIYNLRNENENALRVTEKGFEHSSNPDFLSNIFWFASLLERKDIITKYLEYTLKKKSLLHRQSLLFNLLYSFGILDTKDAYETALKIIKNFWTRIKKQRKKHIVRIRTELWTNMTWIYIVTNKMDKTFEEIVKAYLSEHKKDMSNLIYENIAWFYLKKGQIDKCIQYLKEGKKKKAPKYGAKYFKELKDHPDYQKLFK